MSYWALVTERQVQHHGHEFLKPAFLGSAFGYAPDCPTLGQLTNLSVPLFF